MISTDRKIFEEGSAVRARQIEYAKEWGEVHIIIFNTRNSKHEIRDKSEIINQKLTPDSGQGSETVIAPNCWAYSTNSMFKLRYPFDAIKLGRFIIERRGITDITCQDSSLTAMAGLSLKKQSHLPVEIQIHEDIGSLRYAFNITNKIRRALALSYIPKADHIRVVSNRIKDFLVDTLKVDPAKVEVRPITVDTARAANAAIIPGADLHKKYPQFEKIVLMATRLGPEKNVGLAVRAWARIVGGMPRAGLVVVGSGSQYADLLSLISDLSVADSVILEPWADQSTLFSYYKTADLFLNTSLFEGYGMTLVEAHAAGCPIVSTDVGVAREVGATIVGWDEEEVMKGVVAALSEDKR